MPGHMISAAACMSAGVICEKRNWHQAFYAQRGKSADLQLGAEQLIGSNTPSNHQMLDTRPVFQRPCSCPGHSVLKMLQCHPLEGGCYVCSHLYFAGNLRALPLLRYIPCLSEPFKATLFLPYNSRHRHCRTQCPSKARLPHQVALMYVQDLTSCLKTGCSSKWRRCVSAKKNGSGLTCLLASEGGPGTSASMASRTAVFSPAYEKLQLGFLIRGLENLKRCASPSLASASTAAPPLGFSSRPSSLATLSYASPAPGHEQLSATAQLYSRHPAEPLAPLISHPQPSDRGSELTDWAYHVQRAGLVGKAFSINSTS